MALVLISGTDPLVAVSGHETYVRAHARAARQAGFEPHLFCVGGGAGVVETDLGPLHRVWSPFRPLRQIMVPLHGPLIAAGVRRFLAARPGLHLIHGFGAWGSVGARVSLDLRRRGISAVPLTSAYTVMAHESRAKVRGHRGYPGRTRTLLEHVWITRVASLFERRAYRDARCVLVNYDSVRRLLAATYGLHPDVRTVPYAPESAFLRSEGVGPEPDDALATLAGLEPPTAPLIVAVSRHDPRKGLDILLHALAALRHRKVPFRACLVGRGPLLETHRRLAERLGLGRTTVLPGLVPDAYAFLARADVFVLPSLAEGSGSVSLLEALQAGVAIVASAVDGIPEDVRHDHSALLVEPGNVPALTDALVRALTDTMLRQRLAQASRETFTRRFSAGALAVALGETYASLGFSVPRCR